ncbi:MAG TPA: FHA domain-containing protein [Candidatus Methylomirabilis sp.]|nr:FHA domain-containing protein [Candidatus Methylomirabilis sp.]
MIIECGHCGAKYKVEEARIPRGGLTCKKCQGPLPVPSPSETRGRGGPESTIVGRIPTASGAPLSAASAVRISLVIQAGPDGGKTYPVTKDRVIIGRKTGDLILNDPEVSGSHASLEIVGNTYFLRDLRSTNGTYLNGTKVAEAQLKHLDEIGLGKSTLIFTVSHAGD